MKTPIGQNKLQASHVIDEQTAGASLPHNPVAQRVVPKQTRAHERIVSILEATEILLAQGANVTTSTIAKQARIPVGSIYRYFPNIMGIYAALFEKLSLQVDSQITLTFETADSSTNTPIAWRDLFKQLMAVIHNAYMQYPALSTLRLMSATPELAPIQKASSTAMAKLLEDRNRSGLNGFQNGDPKTVAITVVELISWLELSVFTRTDKQANKEALYAEGLKVIEAYLTLYFTD